MFSLTQQKIYTQLPVHFNLFRIILRVLYDTHFILLSKYKNITYVLYHTYL